MNYLNIISYVFFIIAFLFSFRIYGINLSYQQTIQHYAQDWTQKYMNQSCDQETQTMLDLLLLSYQIVKESCNMVIAKFTMQQELFKIYTPSFIDSWQENLQINQNDTTKLEEALLMIKKSQKNLKEIYEEFRKLIPYLLKINPKATQSLIIDLKNSLLMWGKYQQLLTDELINVQHEFAHAIAHISDIKNFFELLLQSHEVKHTYLKDAADFYAKTYKEIDLVSDHLLSTRITGILKIQDFFEYFFKSYYTILYNNLNFQQKEFFSLHTQHIEKNIQPDAFFA